MLQTKFIILTIPVNKLLNLIVTTHSQVLLDTFNAADLDSHISCKTTWFIITLPSFMRGYK